MANPFEGGIAPRRSRLLDDNSPVAVLQAALEATSDYETEGHARDHAMQMFGVIRSAGWIMWPCGPDRKGGK